jgi:hypothetical protein
VTPRVVQKMMRHSKLELTGQYTRPRLVDLNRATESLPSLRPDHSGPEVSTLAATGTDNAVSQLPPNLPQSGAASCGMSWPDGQGRQTADVISIERLTPENTEDAVSSGMPRHRESKHGGRGPAPPKSVGSTEASNGCLASVGSIGKRCRHGRPPVCVKRRVADATGSIRGAADLLRIRGSHCRIIG